MAESSSVSGLKTYYGNCQCAAVKFNVKLPELNSVTECNCSICFKKAYKWVFPGAGCFTFEKGEETLKEYEFGQKTMIHKFCGICGTGIQGKRRGMPAGSDIGVNLRALRDFDIVALTVNKYDGIDREPAYVPPTYVGSDPPAEVENAKIYTGSCHCGSVTLAMKTSGPITQAYVCDCSICVRSGAILFISTKSAVQITNPESQTVYQFGYKTLDHVFCRNCGVKICSKETGDVKDKNTVYANLRCFEGIDWDDLKYVNISFKDVEPLYVVE